MDYNYCALPLAAYACRPDLSRGRLHTEQESAVRTAFQRDRDRIIHTAAFRKLRHKTQVFVSHEGDTFRTRLTHTLEVAQITRTLARALLVNEDLAEAIALAHDLGHPPFAHTGEDVLAACMKNHGGFEHNDQSLRVLTQLEQRYPTWDGLNLTWETLEGVVKHNGPVKTPLPFTLKAFNAQYDLEVNTFASIEAQVAAISDDIAYNSHDIEDGLGAGLFTLQDLAELPLLAEILNGLKQKYPTLENRRLIIGLIRELIGRMVEDVLETAKQNLAKHAPQSPEAARKAGQKMVDFSPSMAKNIESLRQFLWGHMYRAPSIMRMRLKSTRVVEDIFNAYMNTPALIAAEHLPETERARLVCDTICSMTDVAALQEHQSLFGI